MNRHVNAIAGRLSLRPPQRRSLEILDRVTEIAPPKKGADVQAALEAIKAEFSGVTDFEREFPSICFALATGVGKTRLMGAFVSYLHLAHGINNFFVLAPNLTIYNKLIADFTPNTPKYVFKGIAEFVTSPPEIITGDNYEQRAAHLQPGLLSPMAINIFNISKINSEVRGGKAPRIKRLSEYIGESYFDFLANRPDLVLLMDESHRYRASAGIRAINELKPIIGLELTATPYVETAKGAVPFKNVIFDYALGKAMEDGFVKEPAVVTRKDFNPAGMSPEDLEQIKLEDGVRLHESVKVELETYARETGNPIVKPFVLVIARDTTHAGSLLKLIQSDRFFDGRYKDKVIQVDSSKTGAEEDEMVERLLKVEHTDEPTEIVIHVNMLKEGWDVTNLYTIVPLRAANAKILIEQSIGRGLRLPYGKRTGKIAVDRLNIVAHDRFQEIVAEANKPGSAVRMATVLLEQEQLQQKTVTVVSQPQIASILGISPQQMSGSTVDAGSGLTPAFSSQEDLRAAQVVYQTIQKLQSQPSRIPGTQALTRKEIQAAITLEAETAFAPQQLQMGEITKPPDIAAIVARTTELIVQKTIDIPRITVMPKGTVRSGFRPFTLNLKALTYQPVSQELWIQHLRTEQRDELSLGGPVVREKRIEDHVVAGLVDFDDVSYDDHADFLYELAGQTVQHFRSYLKDDEEIRQILQFHRKEIAHFIHVQMQPHYWEEAEGYEASVSKGFTELKPVNFTANKGEPPRDFRQEPEDKTKWGQYRFAGFKRCLYPEQKFGSDPERKMAVILDRDSVKWMRPASGQFQIFYRIDHEQSEYQPDFVAETDTTIYLLEPKRKSEMTDAAVLAKKDAAVAWCGHATEFTRKHGGKPWKYVLIPHDAIAENMSLEGLAKMYG